MPSTAPAQRSHPSPQHPPANRPTSTNIVKEEQHPTKFQWVRGLKKDGTTAYIKVTLTESNCVDRFIRPSRQWYSDLIGESPEFIGRAAIGDSGESLRYDLKRNKFLGNNHEFTIRGKDFTQLLKRLNVQAGDCLKMEKIGTVNSPTADNSGGKMPVVLFSVIKRKDNPDAEQVLRIFAEYQGNRGKGRERKPRSEKEIKNNKKKRIHQEQETHMDQMAHPQQPGQLPLPPPPSGRATDWEPAVLLTRKLLRNDDDKVVGVKCSVYFEPGSRSLKEISAAISRFGIDCGDTGVVVDDYEVLPAENLVNATLKVNTSSHSDGDGDGATTAALNKAIQSFIKAL